MTDQNTHQQVFQQAVEQGFPITLRGYYHIVKQMEQQQMDGFPCLDAKTFQGWKKDGFLVKKGEKSRLKGLTFVGMEDAEGNHRKQPRTYSLFHRSQVEKKEQKND